MQDWNWNVQRVIDFVERNIDGDLSLERVAKRLGYSRWWCTRQFTKVCGLPLRSYIRARRLSLAAVELRDSRRGILEVALRHGFSSQEAFTRAFRAHWGIAPGEWRKRRQPITLTLPAHPWKPLYNTGGETMSIQKITTSVQEVPARAFIGIWAHGSGHYFEFWEHIGKRGLNCELVEGTLAGLTANLQIGGWLTRDGVTGYLYGVEVPADYSGPIPEGMELIPIPAAKRAVMHHPPYDFDSEDQGVWNALKDTRARFTPPEGYRIDGTLPVWQRHDPASMGQSWCIPLRKA